LTNLSTLLEPNYTLLTFLAIKTFAYVEIIGLLGLIRAIGAAGTSRWMGLGAFILAITAVAAKYGPALTGLTGTEIGNTAAHLINAGRKHWLLDAVHALCACAFFGLWIYTLQ
jgi:hypothetical protein